ncbi:TetR/AcrR family transcriptional regulator [uncultured Pseudokineococcus sp.]|uniref:TetR/AcrR family transcriptional regulator n=1 Tax=uncultured Pseudokineococcus sp. TaxID=1642928 RepID=UPI002620C1B1|nr:TetR/AcrR family transcriptional regulator [uncultured Pseudokineococcus sp.]
MMIQIGGMARRAEDSDSVDERPGEPRPDQPGPGHPVPDQPRPDHPSPGPGRGPRGARGEIRRRITEAALRSFADHGLDGSSTRAIAREADCDPALVRYYFASKQQLFAHVTERPQALGDQLDAMASLPHGERAAYLAHLVATCWDDPSTGAFWRSLLRTGATDPGVARTVEDTWSEFVSLGIALDPAWPADGSRGDASGADGPGEDATGQDATGQDATDQDAEGQEVARRRRSVVALTSITGMLAAVHLWSSARARDLSQQERSAALAALLQGCFTAAAPGD